MAKDTYYHTCADCGANLDPGERCDCVKPVQPAGGVHRVVGVLPGRDLVEAYRQHLTLSGAPANTVRTYLSAVERLGAFLSATYGVDISTRLGLAVVSSEQLMRYFETLLREEKKRSSKNLYVSALRAFFAYHIGRGHLSENPALALPYTPDKYGHVDARPEEALYYSTGVVREVLTHLESLLSRKTKARDLALFALLCASAMRISEGCSLNVRDMPTIRQGYARIIGKGGMLERVNIAAYAVPYLEAYLTMRGPTDGDAPLFLSQRGGRLTANASWKAFARFQKPLDVPTGTHICRHTALTHIAHLAGIIVARDAARHRNVRTTEKYVHRDDGLVAQTANTTALAASFTQAEPDAS